ncbi:MAG: nicotinamide riboside transporter PnuC [Verrucomicrobiota bacterium]
MEFFSGITTNRWIEIIGTVLAITYVILIARGKRAGWWFGIFSSLLSIWLFIRVNLLAESFLYLYYVVVGFYGYYSWTKEAGADARKTITTRPASFHIVGVALCSALSVGLAQILDFLGSAIIYADAATTVFSFFATWMVAKRILENWIYWIVIDLFSVWLYNERGLPVYAGLMALYTILATAGFFLWLKEYRKSPAQSNTAE